MVAKKDNWFRRHWILSTLITMFVFFILISLISDETSNSGSIKEEFSNSIGEDIESVKSKVGLTEITIDKGINSPSLSEDYVLFNTGGWSGSKGDIYSYNINSGEIEQITYDNSDQYWSDIEGGKIVWIDKRFGNEDIFIYDILEKKEERLPIDENAGGKIHYDNLLINKEIVYWASTTDYDYYSLNLFNLKTSEYNKINIEGGTLNGRRGINGEGDKIVYSPIKYGKTDIYVYDLNKNQITQITNDSYGKKDPCIFGNKVVWSDNRNGLKNYDLYMLDLQTGEEKQITTFQDTEEIQCSIYEDKIVYKRLKSAGDDEGYSLIYIHDLTTSENKQISNDFGGQYPLIYKNKVVWEGYNSDSWYAKSMVYLYTF